MTHSAVRLWDHDFRHIVREDIREDDIKTTGENIRVISRRNAALYAVARHLIGGELHPRNLHLTIDPDADNLTGLTRYGGIVTKIEYDHAGTVTLTAHAHTTPLAERKPEIVTPPRGYGIGLLGGGNEKDTIIGCWATENEARAALADMRIVALGGAPVSWWDQ